MQIVYTEDNLHGMSNPVDNLCEMPKSVFREKWKKKTKTKKLQNVICRKFYTEYLALKRLIVKTSWVLCDVLAFT